MPGRRFTRAFIVAAGAAVAFAILLGLYVARRHDGATGHGGATGRGAAEPTVASISPAATDLILGIGAGRHLAAVCDKDEDRDGVRGLPRVGDFNHVDWEKLAALGPQILVTQFGNRMQADVKDQCDRLGIRLIDVRLDELADIYREADVLGAALNEEAGERAAVAGLKARLAAVGAAVAGLPSVRAAIVVNDGGSLGLIGAGAFHDELLTIAGGVNVAGGFGKPYVYVDREQLTALAPDVVLDLEPAPPTTPQQMRQAEKYWSAVPDLPAVKAGRVYAITEPYSERPGWRVADLAEVFAEKLHPGYKEMRAATRRAD